MAKSDATTTRCTHDGMDHIKHSKKGGNRCNHEHILGLKKQPSIENQHSQTSVLQLDCKRR